MGVNDTTNAQAARYLHDLDAVVAAVEPGAKNPITSRPRGPGVPWRTHKLAQQLLPGLKRLGKGEPLDLYLVPGSVHQDGRRLACADLDRKGALKRIGDSAGTNLLVFENPSKPGHRHVWGWIPEGRRPGSTALWWKGSHEGEWRAARVKDGEISEGAGMRLYPGEPQALVHALHAEEIGTFTEEFVELTQAPAWSARVRRACAELGALGKGERHPSLLSVLRPIERWIDQRGEFEHQLVQALAPAFAGEPNRKPDVEIRDALDKIESDPSKPKRARRKADYEQVTKELRGNTLDRPLKARGFELRYNLRWMLDEYRKDTAEWKVVDDRAMEHIRSILGGMGWEDRVWRNLYLNTLYHHEVDPFLDWLEALPPWDGTRRVDRWATDAFEIAEDDFEQAIARWTSIHVFLGAVKRTLEPGAKLDTTPVLVGDQSIGKSWHLSLVLPPELRGIFGDDLNLAGSAKEMLEAIQGKALVEIAEMHGAGGAKLDRLKAFMTRTHDSGVRLAYRRNPEVSPRRCIFVGTVNDDGNGVLPNDNTGNRRWSPLRVLGRRTHPHALMHARPQYWAEALHRVKAGESPSFPSALESGLAERNEDHRQKDPMEALIGEEVQRMIDEYRREDERNGGMTPPDGWTFAEIVDRVGLLGRDEGGDERKKHPAELPVAVGHRLGRALRALGIEKDLKKTLRDGYRGYRWRPRDGA